MNSHDVFPPPAISVIIATYNAAQTLERCLDSFLSCDLGNLEITIKDGDSTDATLTILKAYAGRLPLRVISQPDSGIYDAWNQAIEHGKGLRGRWVLFLGADDFIASAKNLTAAAKALRDLPGNVAYAAAPVTLVNDRGFAVDTVFPSRELERDLPTGMPLPHQGLFHRSSLFIADRFDAALSITGDYDFLCRTLTPDNLVYLDLPAPICMSLGGVSGSLKGMVRRNREALRVSKRFFSGCSRAILWKRLALSYLFNVLARGCGARFAAASADFYRKLRKKPPIWKAGPPALSVLPMTGITPESSGRPMFSLLVATINRKEPLQKFLDSLLRQNISPDTFEVFIADQNPPGFLQSIIDDYTQFLHIRVVPVPNKGVSLARNALLPLAAGQYIAFPDDDCLYGPNTLHEARKFFATHLHVHVIHGSWSAPGCLQNTPGPHSLGTRYSIFRRGETYVQFFRKEAVELIGAFDPVIGPGTGLPYGCGEDTDYLLRAIKAGLIVMHVPLVHVHHNEVDMLVTQHNTQKISSYAIGRMYLLRKHNLPLWFQIYNIAYPLLRIAVEGAAAARYRFIMFKARLYGFYFVRTNMAPGRNT